jgi:hypothetical protein
VDNPRTTVNAIAATVCKTADSGIGFTPRWVAMAHGYKLEDVIWICEKLKAFKALQSYEHEDGEIYYRNI